MFHQLSPENILKIVDLMVAQIEDRLKDKDMGIELTQAAKELIAKRGFDPVLGARPLRRAIQRDIEDVLAEKILFGEVAAGDIVVVDVNSGSDSAENPFVFTGNKRAELPETPAAVLTGGGESDDSASNAG